MFMSIHRIDGDSDDLLARKSACMDAVIREEAGAFGAAWTVTARTETGILTVNPWSDPEGATAFPQLPASRDAQMRSGLPSPSSFERVTDADCAQFPVL